MAVGIRSNARTGSYGSTLANLNADMSAWSLQLSDGRNFGREWNGSGDRFPDYIGGSNGTIYFDWKAVDEANGFTYGANGKVKGTGKGGGETAEEKADRMAKRSDVWGKFVNNIRGSANRVQSQNQSQSMFNSEFKKATGKQGKSVAEATVQAKRHVNTKEQGAIERVAKKSGLKIAKMTQF